MAFVPVPNVSEYFIEHTFNGVPDVGWVIHYETTGGVWTADDNLELAILLKGWWNDHMKANVTAAVQLTRIRWRVLTTATSGIGDYNSGLPITGTLTGQSMPNNVAFSLKKNTGLAGRSNRGRIYQFGFNEADVDGNFIGAGRANAYVAAWTEALLLVGAVNSYGMVVASKYTNNAPRPVGVATDVINISYSDLKIDTHRSRL